MSVVLCRNPFDLLDHEVRPLAAPMRLIDLAIEHGMDPKRAPVIARVDGEIVLQRVWGVLWVRPEQVVTLQALPLGGGRSSHTGNGKSTLATVLSIAVAVAAITLGGPIGQALGFTGIGLTIASATISAAIAIGGNLLINALIPPQSPGNDNRSPSATYSLSARGNAARIGQPIPVVYGRHRVYPAYACTPYSYYIYNEQYLYSVYVIGQGYHTIEDLKLGDNLLSSYGDATAQIVNPGEAVTLFPVNVYQSPDVTGQTMKGTNEGTAAYPDLNVGPFAASNGSAVSYIGIDIALPRGLYYNDPGKDAGWYNYTVNWTVEIRPIDETGAPTTTDFTTLANESLSLNTVDAQYRTYTYQLPATGLWQVRVRRTSTAADQRYYGNILTWAGLRGYTVDQPSFDGLTVVAVKMRATNNLNSSNVRQLNAVVRRKLPVWTGTGWTAPQETRSLAWAAADILRNQVYGGRLPDARIDLAGLLALDATWAARGDEFNGVFDQASTVWEALTKVLRAGRARAYYQGALLRFRRDQPQSLPVAMYGPSNMVADTFEMSFVLPVDGQDVDGVEAEFMNASTWQMATIERGIDGATPTTTAREQLVGITSLAQAAREAEYMAAANRYRRTFVTFQTEFDGLVSSFGDAVLIANDVPRWGRGGDVVAWDPATLTLTLDCDVTLAPGETHTIRLRDMRGNVSRSVTVVGQPRSDQLVLASVPVSSSGGSFTVATADDREPSYWALGSATQAPQIGIVTAITPRSNTIEITAVLEDARVHVN